MTLSLTVAVWWIPLAVTALALCWALFVVKPGRGMFAGLNNIFALVPALAVSLLAWIIYGIVK